MFSTGEDAHGQLWVGTATGLNRWDQTRFNSFFTLEGLPDDRVNAIASLPNGKLVFATGKGLAEFGGVRFGLYDPVPGVPRDDIRLLLPDQEGNLWLADETGLWRIGLRQATPDISRVFVGSVTALAEGTPGQIWLGTAAGTLHKLVANARDAPPVEIACFPSAITALRADRERDLWLGTASNGLSRLKRRQLRLTTRPAGLTGKQVSSLLTLSTDNVWLASETGNLIQWLGDHLFPFEDPQFPKGNQIRVLSGNSESGLWIGTLEDGLFSWKNGQLRHWDELDGLSDNDIEALYVSDHEEVWLGTRNGGLNHFHSGRITRFLTPWGFTGHYTSIITQDRDGRVWIGTTGDGLFSLSNGVFHAYTTQNGLPNNQVRALLADDDGALWVGTAGGLVRFTNQHLTAYTEQDGIPDNEICQLQDDGLGNLWVGCDSGIYRLRKSELRDYKPGQARLLNAVPYGEPDGLPALQCIPRALATESGQPNGSLWFATSKGLVRAIPRLIHWNQLPPPVILEQVLADNTTVPLAVPIRVPPGGERIQFRYAGLSLVAPEKVRFRCQLVGFDHGWVELGNKRIASYAQVPPGHYQFRVSACNNDGVWNPTGASVALVVIPFWWETMWFRLAALTVLGIFVFSLIRQRQVRLREIERLRVRLAGDLHDELGSSLWSINLLSQSLKKYGQMGEEERRDVGEIQRIARLTSNAIRDIVWIINPSFDTTGDLVLRMKDFAGTMLRGLEWRVQCEGVDLSRRLALAFRQHVFLMFKEAVANVAKHARASAVEIYLEERPNFWKLSIRDNGAGFDPSSPVNGHGLHSLRTRAERIGAVVRIDSKPGEGTMVMLTIPKT